MATHSTNCSRSVYVSRLRRAFLLRVHPDRFRCPKRRSQQAKLVQALSNRLSDADFRVWQQHDNVDGGLTETTTTHGGIYSYTIERHNGKTLNTSISLSNSVEQILHSMVHALEQCGASAPPKPTTIPNEPVVSNFSRLHTTETGTSFSSPTPFVSKGRDLNAFLKSVIDTDQIQNLKTARLDAQAAAASLRNVYGFSAVDATATGWSSESASVLFRRLLALHDEFDHTFSVPSFYPMRLIVSPVVNVVATPENLDSYGGNLVLHPAATSIQWLESLQMIAPETIRTIQQRHQTVLERTKFLQGVLGVKLKKGFTCSSFDYYHFLERLCQQIPPAECDSTTTTTTLPSTTAVQAVVEADVNCRRPKVTKQGHIQLGVGMDPLACLAAVNQLRVLAQDTAHSERNQQQLSRTLEQTTLQTLGLVKARRQTERVSHADFQQSLSRLVTRQKKWKDYWTGNALFVASTDHMCHLADDGSIVIPHNWQ